MELLQFQAVIEQFLNYIFSQGPEAIEHLTAILQMIVNGATSVGSVAVIVAKSPALVEVSTQLLALITSGAGIPEIAATLAEFVSTMSISIEALIHLLQLIGSLLLLF
jgi:hypothetical protein